MMTPEQFVYWLSGYLSGMEYNLGNKGLDNILREVLKSVKCNHNIEMEYVTFQGCQL